MIRRWYPSLISIAAVFACLVLWLPASEPVDKPAPIGDSEPGEGVFGVYHPDKPGPFPPDARTIYATRIVLQGPDATIILDANPKSGYPGIRMTSRASGQSVVMYVAPEDRVRQLAPRAVIGTRDKGMPNASTAIFSIDGIGFLQIRDRGGVEVMALDEIVNRR